MLLRHDRSVTGRVEGAVRRVVTPGKLLATPSGRGHFKVACYGADGLILLLGEKEARTPLPWRALEGLPGLLRGRCWVPIGSFYSVDSQPGSLDQNLKRFVNRATAGWVAVVLECAGVVTLDWARPMRIMLCPGW